MFLMILKTCSLLRHILTFHTLTTISQYGAIQQIINNTSSYDSTGRERTLQYSATIKIK